ncbi:MAG: NAD-dependent epimerase/dehydratase family protein [bacterium]
MAWEKREASLEELKGARVLLTGGAGFIGIALARRLAGVAETVIFDALPADALRDRLAAADVDSEFQTGDVRLQSDVAKAAAGCTHILHLASVAGVDSVMSRPLETMEVISEGTLNVLRVAEKLTGFKRLVNFSTSEVFGDMAFKLSEGEPTALGAVGQSRWTYAVSKLMAEHLVYNYHKVRGLPAASIRPFNIYGPGQIGEGAIHHFVKCAIKAEDLTIHNDGTQIRAWCYIDDLVEGVLLALTLDAAVGHSFNIGNPRSTITIYNLAREIKDLAGSESEIKFVDWPFQDIDLRVPNIDKARATLGFAPQVELRDGIIKTIDWYRDKLGRGAAH